MTTAKAERWFGPAEKGLLLLILSLLALVLVIGFSAPPAQPIDFERAAFEQGMAAIRACEANPEMCTLEAVQINHANGSL